MAEGAVRAIDHFLIVPACALFGYLVMGTFENQLQIHDVCRKIQKFKDGPGGRLWKESDHGGLVTLWPNKKDFVRVTVHRRRNGKLIDSLYYTGRANGNRQHWRSRMSIYEFPPKGVVVRAHRKNKHPLCYRIRDPQVRND